MVASLPKRYIHMESWECECFLICKKKKKVFTIVTELRIPRWDHPEFSKWALNPMMCPYKGKVEGHLRQKRGQIWKRDDKKIEDKKKKDWGRVWSHVVLSQGSLGLPTAARNWRLGRIFPRASSARVAPLTAWFQTSGLQNCEGIYFFVLSYPVCGNLLWQQYLILLHLFYCSLQLLRFFVLFCFFLFTAVSDAYGSSWARGWIAAAAAGLHHCHCNAGSELHLWPTM